jgi:hypothetical protein
MRRLVVADVLPRNRYTVLRIVHQSGDAVDGGNSRRVDEQRFVVVGPPNHLFTRTERARECSARWSLLVLVNAEDLETLPRRIEVAQDGIQVKDTSDRRYGKVLAGPELFTVFDGRKGAALATVPYLPGREPQDGRCDPRNRRNPCVADASRTRLTRGRHPGAALGIGGSDSLHTS